jgi:2-oxo-4-hydroxy-4-carboxy-5-ureidoimidazoline decarboxylase
MTQASVDRINALPADEARAEFLRCCGASVWADALTARRPFADTDALRSASDAIWAGLNESDWLEAFSHHPKIGDIDSLRAKFAATAEWASDEQASAAAASEATLRALAEGNTAYEQRFGYIFIVCATGKTADEMLTLLNARLHNAPAEELLIAASEQKKITRLRLDKL